MSNSSYHPIVTLNYAKNLLIDSRFVNSVRFWIIGYFYSYHFTFHFISEKHGKIKW